ncbi:MAG: hypothetical protein ACMXYE_05575 [Candidatus Woesearchaeota archaeon]
MKEFLTLIKGMYEPLYFAGKGTSERPPNYTLKEEEKTPDRLYKPPQEMQTQHKNLELRLRHS